MEGWDDVGDGTDEQIDQSTKSSRATAKPYLKTVLDSRNLLML